jgi:hypothetical protein
VRSTDEFDQPAYVLSELNESSPGWFVAKSRDPAEGDIGGLTVTLSADSLAMVLKRDESRPLRASEVMALDGKG